MTEEDGCLNDQAFCKRLRRTTYSPVVSLVLLVTVVVAIVAYLLYTVGWVDRTNRIIAQGLYTEKLLLDLQTATRGYYLSGDRAFLVPYNQNRGELPAALAKLRASVAHNPGQAAIADRITADSTQWLDWIHGVVETRDPAAGRAAPTTEQVLGGQARFAPAREAIATFLANEYDLRDTRSRHAARTAYAALTITALATLVTAAVQCTGVRRRLTEITDTYRGALRIAKERSARIESLLAELDRELKAVGGIQRSLLPIRLPAIPGLQIAASYQTSRRAGGDYYDFFRLPPEHPDDHRARYGILIADVSGHGTPAAVLMAVTHSIAHSFQEPARPPDEMLRFVNRRLCEAYTTDGATFVTAFYAIYDPATRELTYSSAGHNPPRLRRAGHATFEPLDDAQGLPLGVTAHDDDGYTSATRILRPGDTVVLYTDGITEARNPADEELGVPRLDAAVASAPTTDPDMLLATTLAAVHSFSGDHVEDDRTLLIVRAAHDHHAHAEPGPRHAVIVESPAADPIAAALKS